MFVGGGTSHSLFNLATAKKCQLQLDMCLPDGPLGRRDGRREKGRGGAATGPQRGRDKAAAGDGAGPGRRRDRAAAGRRRATGQGRDGGPRQEGATGGRDGGGRDVGPRRGAATWGRDRAAVGDGAGPGRGTAARLVAAEAGGPTGQERNCSDTMLR
ncbi:unnamed protein product [Closterium sp. NIES-54]